MTGKKHSSKITKAQQALHTSAERPALASAPANTNGLGAGFPAKFAAECMGALAELCDPEHTSTRASVCVSVAADLGVDPWHMLALLTDVARECATRDSEWTEKQVNALADLVGRIRANPASVEDDFATHWIAEGAKCQDQLVGAAGRLAYAATFQARSEGENPAWDGSGVWEEMIEAAREFAAGPYGDGEEIIERIVAGILGLEARRAAA